MNVRLEGAILIRPDEDPDHQAFISNDGDCVSIRIHDERFYTVQDFRKRFASGSCAVCQDIDRTLQLLGL